jgi:hypothetical protein
MNIPKIEKGIPLPARRRGNGKWAELAQAMEPYDSVLLGSESEALSLKQWGSKRGYVFTQRREGEGMRVWLVSNASDNGGTSNGETPEE